MSKTTNENQNTPATPLPAENENGGADSEPEQTSELIGAPVPNQVTEPSIKNT